MAYGNTVTIVGNLTRDPELRFTAGGLPIAQFSVAVNKKTRDGNEETSFFDCVTFQEQAEQLAESLTRGTRVIVTGTLRQATWETDDGQKRSKVEITVDEVGPSLRWATATVTRSQKNSTSESKPASFDPDEEPF